MDQWTLRARRTALIRKAHRHLELASLSPVYGPAGRFHGELHQGAASRCIDQARALTRELHPPDMDALLAAHVPS